MRGISAAPVLALALGLLTGQVHADANTVSAAEAANHVGESAKVCGQVASAKYATEVRRKPTFLNLDRPYPNHVFTALIWGSDRSAFSYPPESLRGQRICVKGTIELYKGNAEIIVSSPSQIEVQR
jgi:DNA/RNA endonuclease YhcR with UshA esterase domain